VSFWTLFEYGAWVVAALVAAWLLYDAFRVGRDYDEDFLIHTVEDLGEEADWMQVSDDSDERPQS